MAAQNFEEWFNAGHKSWNKQLSKVVWEAAIRFAEENFNSKQQTKTKICPECGAKWPVTTQPGFIECGCGAWL